MAVLNWLLACAGIALFALLFERQRIIWHTKNLTQRLTQTARDLSNPELDDAQKEQIAQASAIATFKSVFQILLRLGLCAAPILIIWITLSQVLPQHAAEFSETLLSWPIILKSCLFMLLAILRTRQTSAAAHELDKKKK